MADNDTLPPDKCPGCGTEETQATRLYMRWSPLAEAWLCAVCVEIYAKWETHNTTVFTVRDEAKPDCVKNVERIKAEEAPVYRSGNPFLFGGSVL